MSRLSRTPFAFSPGHSNETDHKDRQSHFASLVQKYQWKKLHSDYFGMSSYFYDPYIDTIIEHDNVTGALSEHRRGSEVFSHLASLNLDIIAPPKDFASTGRLIADIT